MSSSPNRRLDLARKRQFERLVVRVLDRLPPHIRSVMNNVEIVIEDEPADGSDCLGLYEGTPRIERLGSDTLVLPDKITLFRGPLTRSSNNLSELSEQVRITIVHELGHHVGLDEQALENAGYG